MTNKPIRSCIIAVEGLSLSADEVHLLSKYNPIGVSIFARNVKDKIQLKKLVDDIKNVIGRDDVLIAVDQEGGRVRRLAEPSWRPYASQMTLGKVAAEASNHHAELISRDLREIGVNLNYAPVLDVRIENTTLALKSRCFSDDKDKVVELGRIMVDEYIRNGICPCLKHMPGTGGAVVDSHLQLPVIDLSLEEMQKDFYPFRVLNYAPCGMTGHFLVPWLDDKYPITQSKKAIDALIRGEIGFDGFLISDALDMRALQGSFGDKVRVSLEAGCDATCMYSANMQDLIDVCENSQILSDKSLNRFEKIKKVFKNKLLDQDWDNVSSKYDSIIGPVETYSDEYDATEVLKKMKHKG